MADNECDRRDFLKLGATVGAGLTIGSPALAKAEFSEKRNSKIMENLGLAKPKMMDIAVPANLKCGLSTTTTSENL